MQNIIWFENTRISDIAVVGGKNASLGEMISQLAVQNINVPGGFATTANAYKNFLQHNNLIEQINQTLMQINVSNVIELAKAGRFIHSLILEGNFPEDFEADIEAAYNKMFEIYGENITLAVRSSATAEDLPDASFAGQQDSFLNVCGISNLKLAIKRVFASLFNDRAISYRVHKGFSHDAIQISAGVQKMVRSDLASSGVMFTIDPESGFDQVIYISSSYGLGEAIVQGMVNPDEIYLYKNSLNTKALPIIRKNIGSKVLRVEYSDVTAVGKSVRSVNVNESLRKQFSITDQAAIELANAGLTIEKHYGCPMDIEWGIDGIDGKIYILQARPETVKVHENNQTLQSRYQIASHGEAIVTGRAVGQKASSGRVRVVNSIDEIHTVMPGDVLVTDMTDPDWEPVMQKASAIVTNRGGRTCHAAIIARELGIPAVVGCEDATSALTDAMMVTVSCCEGDTGYVYAGELEITKLELNYSKMPELPVSVMMNVGNPELAFKFAAIPNAGVGLARLEFIINRQIGIHPSALLDYDNLPLQLKEIIDNKIAGYESPVEFYVDKLSEGIATIAAAFYPKPVIVRLSDFKSNEYSNLVAGNLYEPIEDNPMIGFRGASRYIAPSFRGCFELECFALAKVRRQMNFKNVAIMVPFVRTTDEAEAVIKLLAENGLERNQDGLAIYMMCEIPSNAILAKQFLQYFDGFSIGSNDMTQLTLGIDRDANGAIAASFDERNEAVKTLLHLSIKACLDANKYIGICGQGPSDHPDFAKWLIDEGIKSISLNPDSVVDTWIYLAQQL